jgi:hypothetical protein
MQPVVVVAGSGFPNGYLMLARVFHILAMVCVDKIFFFVFSLRGEI